MHHLVVIRVFPMHIQIYGDCLYRLCFLYSPSRPRSHSLLLLRHIPESGQQAVSDGQATSGEERCNMEQGLVHLERHRKQVRLQAAALQ